MTTGTALAIQAHAYGSSTADNNIAQLGAIEGHIGIKAATTVIADVGIVPNYRAAWFKIEDLGNDLTLTGDAAVVTLGMQFNTGTTLTGMADWIFVSKEGSLTDPADAFVRAYDGAGGGWANYLFDIPLSLPVFSGTTYGDGSHTHSIRCKVGTTAYYIRLHAV